MLANPTPPIEELGVAQPHGANTGLSNAFLLLWSWTRVRYPPKTLAGSQPSIGYHQWVTVDMIKSFVTMRALTVALVASTSGSGGCARFIDVDSTTQRDTNSSLSDMSHITDGHVENVDGPHSDGDAADTARPDANLDSISDSAPLPGDAARDSKLLQVDTLLPRDAGPDLGPTGTGGCSATARWLGEVNGIVSCETVSTTGENQCSAETLCNGTTHRLCRASEYQVSFRDQAPPAELQGAWMAGCVYRGGEHGVWLESTCGSCNTSAWFSSNCVWTCGTHGGSCPSRQNAGLYSAPDCQHAGIDSPALAAYWDALGTDFLRRRTLCCPMP